MKCLGKGSVRPISLHLLYDRRSRLNGFYKADFRIGPDVFMNMSESVVRRCQQWPARHDFWVFNWHFNTMGPFLDKERVRKLPGRKFAIVLEVEPWDPLAFAPRDVFDGFLVLDPSVAPTEKVFPFPRPLEQGLESSHHPIREIPIIGSFGYGTPGKGFELLVEAVNREFEKAVIRINVPSGTYTSATDVIHRQDYAKHLASICKRIAKPGIEIQFTQDFMSPEELVKWCAENDLNCFLYTRRQSRKGPIVLKCQLKTQKS